MRAVAGIPLRRRQTTVVVAGVLLLTAMTLIAAAHGAASIAYSTAAAVVLERFGLHLDVPYTLTEQRIIEFIRLPRIVAALLVGAALGVAGAVPPL